MKEKHSHSETAPRAQLENSQELQLGAKGYWLADAFDETGRSARKTYFCTMMHGGVSGSDMYRAFLDKNGIVDGRSHDLAAIVARLEAGQSPDLAGSILQAREEPDGKGITTKVYLAPIAKEGLGIRRAAKKIADVVQDHLGQDAGREAYRKILERHALYPLFYISVALRPTLEIETYFDCEEEGAEVHRTENILQLVRVQHGDRMPISRIEAILRVAGEHGFRCKQVAADLLGGEDEITLYLDRPEDREVEHFRDILSDLLALDGRTMEHWRGSPLRLDKRLTPSLVGVKLQARRSSRMQLVIEEMDRSVIGSL